MENCENLKKMSFKGLEKRPRIFSPYVAILRYLDLACLPLYIIRIPVNCREEAFLKKIKTRVEEEMEIEDKKGIEGINKNNDPPIPKFAHICTSVRKKKERKQLIGFDCKQCEHYYQSRLDDGFTNDQVEEMKNRISKHRGLFKPPLTPERFWDPDIIEDSAEDPRSKIIHDASPLRKRREEKAFEVGEVVNGDEFE